MDATIALGALLGAAFQKLLDKVSHEISETHKFKGKLGQLKQRLETLIGKLEEINQKGPEAQQAIFPEKETKRFCELLEKATELISDCSGVHSWNLYHKGKFGKRIDGLVESIDEFLKVNLEQQIREVLVKVIEINKKLDHEYGPGTSSGRCLTVRYERKKKTRELSVHYEK